MYTQTGGRFSGTIVIRDVCISTLEKKNIRIESDRSSQFFFGEETTGYD